MRRGVVKSHIQSGSISMRSFALRHGSVKRLEKFVECLGGQTGDGLLFDIPACVGDEMVDGPLCYGGAFERGRYIYGLALFWREAHVEA